MKKRIIIISSIILVLLIIGLSICIILNSKNKKEAFDDKIVSTLTIDVNPSIEINLNKDNIVVSVNSLNNDSNKIINSNDYEKLKIEEALDKIYTTLKENNYLNEKTNLVLINIDSTNDKLKNEVEEISNEFFGLDKDNVELVIQSATVTEELRTLAEENNISISKAYYINEQIKNKDGLEIKDFKNVSLNEIKTKVDTYNKEQEIKEKTNQDKQKNQTNTSKEVKAETKTENKTETTSGGYGSLRACEKAPENFTKENMYSVIKTIVPSDIAQFVGHTYEAYGVLYNKKCGWRMDFVYNGAEHAFIYDITNGEQLAHINKSCNACNYDQIMNLSKGYLIEGTNVISVGSGGYESKTSDITYTLNGEVHTVVFDRYTGDVKSIN